jgi:hypothetical protein
MPMARRHCHARRSLAPHAAGPVDSEGIKAPEKSMKSNWKCGKGVSEKAAPAWPGAR